jgi:OOP family OmpA-OmpF porin
MKILSFLLIFVLFSCAQISKNKSSKDQLVSNYEDLDGDGIDDENDKCPNTRKSSLVNGYGCEEKESIQFIFDIEFAKNSSRIPHEFKDELTNLAKFLQKHPKTRAVIEGHTDNSESKSKSMAISDSRAQAVRNFLIEKFGIDAARLSSVGYGSKMPIANNKTKEGRKMNRRVVAVITSIQN